MAQPKSVASAPGSRPNAKHAVGVIFDGPPSRCCIFADAEGSNVSPIATLSHGRSPLRFPIFSPLGEGPGATPIPNPGPFRGTSKPECSRPCDLASTRRLSRRSSGASLLPMPEPTVSYSARKACMGLILVARLAGIHAAATVIPATARIAVETAIGSSGLNS